MSKRPVSLPVIGERIDSRVNGIDTPRTRENRPAVKVLARQEEAMVLIIEGCGNVGVGMAGLLPRTVAGRSARPLICASSTRYTKAPIHDRFGAFFREQGMLLIL